MPNGLLTPGLVLEVAEAVKDYQITTQEFADIMGVATEVLTGVMITGFFGLLLGVITKSLG